MPDVLFPSSMKMPRGGPRRRGGFLKDFLRGGVTDGDSFRSTAEALGVF